MPFRHATPWLLTVGVVGFCLGCSDEHHNGDHGFNRQIEEEQMEVPIVEPDPIDPTNTSMAAGEPQGAPEETDPDDTWTDKPTRTPTDGSPSAPPRLDDLPFSPLLPAFPEYEIPTVETCDWIIERGQARNLHGLDPIERDYLVGPAYEASVAAGHALPVTFCVMDNAGAVVFGGGWHPADDRSVVIERGDGFGTYQAEFVGLTETAEIEISWDSQWGQVEYLGLYNIGLRGPNDSFIIRANGGIGTLIMDGCWWLAHRGYAETGNRHSSGMHIDNWDTLVWRRHQWRGETPDEPGIDLQAHSAYLRAANGVTWILENDLRGGNRTGFQIRPQPSENERPRGPVVIAYNVTDGYGWNNGDTPETFDGGSAMSVWASPDAPTFIFRNEITDAKYGCLMVGAQADDRNWYNAQGFAIADVHIAQNRFENARGDRGAMSVSGVETLHLYDNDVDGRLTLDNRWAAQVHGIKNGQVLFYTDALVDAEIHTFDDAEQRTRQLTRDEKQALRDNAP